MMNPSCLNPTPLTCYSATEVMLITQPNTITKPSFSVCVCVCDMTVKGFREERGGKSQVVHRVCSGACVRVVFPISGNGLQVDRDRLHQGFQLSIF